MGHSGLVNFHRMGKIPPWVRIEGQRHTYVYAFWLVDYERDVDPDEAESDAGVDLIKEPDEHPDWFIHADTADQVLTAYLRPKTWVSPNWPLLFDRQLQSAPLVGSMLIATSNAMYRRHNADGQLWWCDYSDLTWRGRLLMQRLNNFYGRRALLVTFLDKPVEDMSTDEEQQSPRSPLT